MSPLLYRTELCCHKPLRAKSAWVSPHRLASTFGGVPYRLTASPRSPPSPRRATPYVRFVSWNGRRLSCAALPLTGKRRPPTVRRGCAPAASHGKSVQSTWEREWDLNPRSSVYETNGDDQTPPSRINSVARLFAARLYEHLPVRRPQGEHRYPFSNSQEPVPRERPVLVLLTAGSRPIHAALSALLPSRPPEGDLDFRRRVQPA